MTSLTYLLIFALTDNNLRRGAAIGCGRGHVPSVNTDWRSGRVDTALCKKQSRILRIIEGRQCTCNVKLRRVRVTIVAVEKQ